MSFPAAVQTILFHDKDGASISSAAIIKNRFYSVLIWQSILSTALFFLSKALFFLLPLKFHSPILLSLLAFFAFHFALLLYYTSLFILSSARQIKPASALNLLLRFTRFIFVPATGNTGLSIEDRTAMKLSLNFVPFVVVSSFSGSVLINSICWSSGAFGQALPWHVLVGMLGFRGAIMGLFYGVHYAFKQRWVLQFPIIQRPLYFSFKMGIPSAIRVAFKLSTAAFLLSSIISCFVLDEHENKVKFGKFIAQQIILYFGNFMVFLCWEFIHHLHEVIHTKRFIFAPPKGSAAAEANPSEHLLSVLEESKPKSLLQYLAYLDLYMVCERNVDIWRRAAFFEETGETYKRVMGACLKPLEQFTLKLGELEGSSADKIVQKPFQLADQLRSPTNRVQDSKLQESFNDLQLCEWCAWVVASLTARSRKEDRFGVAQLTGSNAAVLSTLLSALLAVETVMGKKDVLKLPQNPNGPATIRWASITETRAATAGLTWKKRISRPVHLKAYAIADALRTSIYNIVSAFHDEMLECAKARRLEKDWITGDKALFGNPEHLLQKLHMFLEFCAC